MLSDDESTETYTLLYKSLKREEVEHEVGSSLYRSEIKQLMEFRSNMMDLKACPGIIPLLTKPIYFQTFEIWLQAAECHGKTFKEENFLPFLAKQVAKTFTVCVFQNYRKLQ